MKLKHWSGAFALLFAASCRPPATSGIVPGSHSCRVPGDTTVTLDTVRIAFAEPENEAGRLLLRLSGETLVRFDCAGLVHPGLARRWTRDSSGSSWTFELDTAITAAALIQQWDLRRNGGLWPWVRILEARAAAFNRLDVRLDTVFASIPASFALPGLVVAPSRLPQTGPVASIQVHPPALDQRDLLDAANGVNRGVDLLVTRNPAVINYARSKPGIAVVPLAWDRTYVTVAPLLSEQGVEWTAAARATLARDVVRADARAAVGPFWWENAPCRGTMPLLPMGRRQLVVYLQGDETGRELAERMVAIQKGAFRAAGLPAEEFTASLAGGEAAVYILSLPRVSPGSCSAASAWPSASTVVPLVDVRAHALIRPGVPSFSIEADGTLHFDRLMPIVSLPGSAP